MNLPLDAQLEAALNARAQAQGTAPEEVALQTLRERLLPPPRRAVSHEEWKRRLREAASNCGVSLSDEAVSSEGIYD